MNTPLFFHLVFAFLLYACVDKSDNEKKKIINYDWKSPIQTTQLPKELKEISGIQYMNDSLIACVQDEDGKILFVNPYTSLIESSIRFSKNGDYEDLVKVGNSFFILRSDGTLFEYTDAGTNVYDTGLSTAHNMESLTYDKANRRLLLGDKAGKNPFYVFDLQNRTLKKAPLFTLENENISPTGMSFHPISKELFVLGKDRIVTVNEEGAVLQTQILPPSLFPQPEGISFKPNGNILISNEGKGNKNATILEYKFKPHEK